MNKKIAFSGVQPSGVLHIGNFLGAIKNWVEIQNDYLSLFCIVDLHAITVKQDPKELREQTLKLIATYLAAGIDPKKSTIFIQSHVPAHTELAWILNTITHMGELERMTQYKDKSQKLNSVGLYDYPILMAADILLYGTDIVPVGEDQVQHVELTRTLAKRFNSQFGETFKIPAVKINKETARIMGLDDPAKKMSKSATSEYNYIALTDNADTIRRKISKAVTDSGKDIKFDPKRAGLYNLLSIYKAFSEIKPPRNISEALRRPTLSETLSKSMYPQTIQTIEKKFANKGYGDFKKDLSDLLIEKLRPFQEKYNKLITNEKYLLDVARDGAMRAEPMAQKTLQKVKEKIGLI